MAWNVVLPRYITDVGRRYRVALLLPITDGASYTTHTDCVAASIGKKKPCVAAVKLLATVVRTPLRYSTSRLLPHACYEAYTWVDGHVDSPCCRTGRVTY